MGVFSTSCLTPAGRPSPRTTCWSSRRCWTRRPRRPSGPTSARAWTPEARLPPRRVAARVHGVAVEVVVVQVHGLAGQLAAPQVPQNLQLVVYLPEPRLILAARAVRPFAGQQPLPLLG